jgi:hypothetical protein
MIRKFWSQVRPVYATFAITIAVPMIGTAKPVCAAGPARETALFLQVSPAVRVISPDGRLTEARPFDPIRIGDRIELGPGAGAEIVFETTGKRYRLAVAPRQHAGIIALAVSGGDLAARVAGGSSTVQRTVLTTLPARDRALFTRRRRPGSGVRDAALGSFAVNAGIGDALANPARDATISLVATSAAPASAGYSVSIYLPAIVAADENAVGPETKVWSAQLGPDSPSVILPAGTLKTGMRYHWVLQKADATVASGALHTLTSGELVTLNGFLDDVRDAPTSSPKDAGPLLLEAWAWHSFGLWTKATDVFRAALARRADPLLETRVAPLLTRPLALRPAADTTAKAAP